MSKQRKFFGTDGIRGQVNRHPMTTQVAHAMGASTVLWLREKGNHGRIRLAIGMDTRRSGDMLEAAFAAGACSMGGSVLSLGIIPTPGVAFLTKTLGAHAGVMISASHNPYQDNGIKLFASDGYKLTDEDELTIEGFLEQALANELPLPAAEEVGGIERIENAVDRYVAMLTEQWTHPKRLDGMRFVMDCANGAAYEAGPRLLRALGAEVLLLGHEPDGVNINKGVGALHPESLAEHVLAEKAHAGIALDGDADRLIVVDEKGQVLDGDHVMAICAPRLLQQGKLPEATVVATVMSNIGLERALRKAGIQLVRTKVGDRYVLEELKKRGAVLGGEQSGHLLFLAHSTTGDGLGAGLQLLQVMLQEGVALSSLASEMTRFPQVLKNVKIREKLPWREIQPIRESVEAVEAKLGETGRVLVRYSGTENKARVMVEGQDLDQIQAMAEEIAQTFADALGA